MGHKTLLILVCSLLFWFKDAPLAAQTYPIEVDTPSRAAPGERVPSCPPDANFVVPLVQHPASQEFPDVDDQRVVWQDARFGPTDIWMADLDTGAVTNLTHTNTWEVQPDLDGDLVVWKDGYNQMGIHGIDLASGQVFTVTEGHADVSRPRLSGDMVVWADNRAGQEDWNIYGYDLVTRVEYTISDAPGRQQDPQIDGKYVVWWDDQEHISLYDLETQQTTPLLTTWGARLPDVSAADQLVVWQDYRNGNWDVYGYDLSTDTERALVIAPQHQENPAIADGLLVFQSQTTTASWNIHIYPLAQEQSFPVTNNPNLQVLPAVDGHTIVWQDARNHQWDIFYADWRGTPGLTCESELFSLQVGALPSQQLQLRWEAVALATAYRIERAKGITGSDWHPLTILPAGTTSYMDMPDELGESYWYRIIAEGEAGEVAYSLETYNSTLDGIPSPDELYLMTLINEVRADPASFGYPTYLPVPPLAYNPLLAYSARAHSQSILNSGFQIGHCDPVGRCPTERARAVGYSYSCSENLTTVDTGPMAMHAANQGFLDSEGHRNNMLAGDLNEFGVGHTYDLGKGDQWRHGQITEVFCGNPNLITPAIPTGAVIPYNDMTASHFTYITNFYSAEGHIPSKAQVFIDGVPHDMALSSGRPFHGTYRYTALLAPGQDHEFFFWFEYGQGQSARWPDKPAMPTPNPPIYLPAIIR
jgi:beta propeller repeat protein